MKRLYLYILKSFIGPFIMTFFICIFILLMQFLWRYLDDIVGKGLDNLTVIELMVYASVSLITLALPLAVLLSSIMTFGNLGERLELLAMKASGVSLLKIMRPLIILVILVSIFAFFMANQVIPVTNMKFAALLYSVKQKRPEMIIKEGAFSNEIDGYSIRVSKVDYKTNTLHNIMIYDQTNRDMNGSVTIADSGYLNMSSNEQYFLLTLYNGVSYGDVRQRNRNGANKTYPFERQKFRKEIVTIGVNGFQMNRISENLFKEGYKMLGNEKIMKVTDSLSREYNSRVENMANGLVFNDLVDVEIENIFLPDSQQIAAPIDTFKSVVFDTVLTKALANSKSEVIEEAMRNARTNQRVINQYSELPGRAVWINKYGIEWHRKYTLSVACLLFFFIGAPLGAIIRKGGFGMPVVISIVMFITYYIVSMMGEKIAREGAWKISYGMWMSTFVYGTIGLFLTYQAVADSVLLSSETYKNFFIKIYNFITRKK